MRKKILFSFLFLFLLLLISSDTIFAAGPEYDQAYAILQNQGPGPAMPLFKKLAEKGDPDSMGVLAYIYKNQSKFDTKYAESAKWYKAYLQIPDIKTEFAMHELGELYMNGGYGLEKDLTKARVYFEKLVGSGWSNKEFSRYPVNDLTVLIGQQMAENSKDDADYVKAGKLLAKNRPTAAIEPLKKSAGSQNPDAMELMGVMYKYGIGVKMDRSEATSWFRKAAEKELPYSMLNMGIVYEKGDGVTQDESIAREWYKKSAIAGNEEAKDILTQKMKNDPLPPELAIDMVKKMRYTKDGTPWGEAVNKFILKPKWEYYLDETDGHVVKLNGYYDDPQKEKSSILIVYLIGCEPNIETGNKSYSIRNYFSSTKGEKNKPGIPDWLAYELE